MRNCVLRYILSLLFHNLKISTGYVIMKKNIIFKVIIASHLASAYIDTIDHIDILGYDHFNKIYVFKLVKNRHRY